jgi:hypothetical protein
MGAAARGGTGAGSEQNVEKRWSAESTDWSVSPASGKT